MYPHVSEVEQVRKTSAARYSGGSYIYINTYVSTHLYIKTYIYDYIHISYLYVSSRL